MIRRNDYIWSIIVHVTGIGRRIIDAFIVAAIISVCAVRTHLLTSDNLSTWRNNRALEMSSRSEKDQLSRREYERKEGIWCTIHTHIHIHEQRIWDRNYILQWSPRHRLISVYQWTEYKRANPELSRRSSIRNSFRDTITVTGDANCNDLAENTGDTLRNWMRNRVANATRLFARRFLSPASFLP